MKGVSSPEEKVRIFHDWIALNIEYDVEGYFSGQVEAYEELDVLRTGKSVCQGYANVFAAMCNAAGIENIIITGYGRGLGFSIFGGEEKYNSNHAWNAVKLSGRWRLIDATWDAGYVDGREFIRRYSTAYFMPDPAEFIYSHFPENNKYQFLPSPLSFDEFRKQPFLREGFFEMRLEFAEKYNLVEKCGSEKILSLNVPSGVNMLASLYNNKGKEISGRTFVQKRDGKINIYVRFPSQGEYELILFASDKGAAEKYDGVANLKLIASEGNDYGFPVVYSDMAASGAVILEPLINPLKADSETEFKIFSKNDIVPGIYAGGSFIELKNDGAGNYSIKVKVPRGEVVLCRKDGDRLSYLCKWDSR